MLRLRSWCGCNILLILTVSIKTSRPSTPKEDSRLNSLRDKSFKEREKWIELACRWKADLTRPPRRNTQLRNADRHRTKNQNFIVANKTRANEFPFGNSKCLCPPRKMLPSLQRRGHARPLTTRRVVTASWINKFVYRNKAKFLCAGVVADNVIPRLYFICFREQDRMASLCHRVDR